MYEPRVLQVFSDLHSRPRAKYSQLQSILSFKKSFCFGFVWVICFSSWGQKNVHYEPLFCHIVWKTNSFQTVVYVSFIQQWAKKNGHLWSFSLSFLKRKSEKSKSSHSPDEVLWSKLFFVNFVKVLQDSAQKAKNPSYCDTSFDPKRA